MTYPNGTRALALLKDFEEEEFSIVKDLTSFKDLTNSHNVSLEDYLGYKFHIT